MRPISSPTALLVSVGLFAQAPAPNPALESLNFLWGTWAAEPDASGAQGEFSLDPALDGRILLRRNRQVMPAQNGRPATVHEDLMLVYAEGGALKADYWDNEGHLIRYTVKPGKDVLELVSSGPGPRFRLSYRLLEKDRVQVDFEIAPPGNPEAFKLYLSGRARRVK